MIAFIINSSRTPCNIIKIHIAFWLSKQNTPIYKAHNSAGDIHATIQQLNKSTLKLEKVQCVLEGVGVK